MVYSLIQTKCRAWYSSTECNITDLICYIEDAGFLRDTQIEAIKTYLFLKIKCENKPLYQLFYDGVFNMLSHEELDSFKISSFARDYLKTHREALSLYQFARALNAQGRQQAPELAKAIEDSPQSIDYKQVFKDIFYGISYTEYLFSLPMGAGKTFLMAAFIYIDLYFAINEPNNPQFAHNFIILVPSGLKSSVVPSLRTIQDFNPLWILPEPAASTIKNLIKFEVLDLQKTAKKSNKTENPNVQKVARYQPYDGIMGLVLVTNAEKVILERLGKNFQIHLLQENDLRKQIAKIPHLGVFIDEVHHAEDSEIKLRKVVTYWAENHSVTNVIGFSGTPYLDKPEKIQVTDDVGVSSKTISHVVYYYSLLRGIEHFLKKPTVKIVYSNNRMNILDAGVREFFHLYKDVHYANGTVPKLAIYCGSIEALEEYIYPHIAKMVQELGMSENVILKFHKGNTKYAVSKHAFMEFETLDKSTSQKRIILLVQVGKEGWDCKSLTGVILSQKGDCPEKMVLQTSCRCLRQVEREKEETALIYLNAENGKKLNEQLKQQQNTSIEELNSAQKSGKNEIIRKDRRDYLALPKLDYYQLSLRQHTLIVQDELDTKNDISRAKDNARWTHSTTEQDFAGIEKNITLHAAKGQAHAVFHSWLQNIVKESFNMLSYMQLTDYIEALYTLFENITIQKEGVYFYSSLFNQACIRADIRKAFYEKRSIEIVEELIEETAEFLKIDNFAPLFYTNSPEKYFPTQREVKTILHQDEKGTAIPEAVLASIQSLEESSEYEMAMQLRQKYTAHPHKNKTYHYLPYRKDSNFEEYFLNFILTLDIFQKEDLEIYYNGERALSDFQIRCYKKSKNTWKYVGLYTPDFLVIKRNNESIHKVLILETKGAGFEEQSQYVHRKRFMEDFFVTENNAKYGYAKFDFHTFSDSMKEGELLEQLTSRMQAFFREN